MSIQIATSEIAPAPVTRNVRNSGPTNRRGGGRGKISRFSFISRIKNKKFVGFRGNRDGGAPQKRRGGGRGAGAGRRSETTVEELDAELDAYTKDMKI